MAGERFLLAGTKDKDIVETAGFLDIEYDKFPLMRVSRDTTAQGRLVPEATTDVMICLSDGKR